MPSSTPSPHGGSNANPSIDQPHDTGPPASNPLQSILGKRPPTPKASNNRKRHTPQAPSRDGSPGIEYYPPTQPDPPSQPDPSSQSSTNDRQGNHAQLLIQDLHALVTEYTPQLADLGLAEWIEICTRIGGAVSSSALRIAVGDDDMESRALTKVKTILQEAIPSAMDIDTTNPQSSSDLPSNEPNSTADQVLTLLREMRQEIHVTNTRVARLENRASLPNTNAHPRNPATTPSKGQSQNPAPNPSYATTTASPPAATNPNSPSQPKPRTQTPLPSPIRFIVRFQGRPPAPTERPFPSVIIKQVNGRLARTPTAKGLELLGSHWNTAGNCVLSFPPQSAIQLIKDHLPCIRAAMNLPDHIVISRDTPWSKMILANVPTRENSSDPAFSEEELYDTLVRNPHIANINITQKPRWIRPPETIEGFKSSITFAFEDPDGAIIKKLMRATTFMFGCPTRPKRWVEKPRLRQCTNCWSLDHLHANCKSHTKCRLCGLKHPESDHRKGCNECKNVVESEPCNHPPVCANCKGPHCADAPVCPERRKYSTLTPPSDPTRMDVL